MKTLYIKVLFTIVVSSIIVETELQAQESINNNLQFNYEESSSHFYQMVKRPSLMIAPKFGLVFNENEYRAEFGLVSARTIPGKTFGFSLSYITASTTTEEAYVTDLQLSQNRLLEATSVPDVKSIGLRASLLLPMSRSWFLTIGGGANILTTETSTVQRYYEYQGELYNSERLLIEESSMSDTEQSLEPVATIGLKTYFGSVMNIGTYASALIEEEFYYDLQIGVYMSFNLAGL